MKTYRQPETGKIRKADTQDRIKVAALEKLGYVELTVEDIKNDPALTVSYQQVTEATVPAEPPALPILDTPTVEETPSKGKSAKK